MKRFLLLVVTIVLILMVATSVTLDRGMQSGLLLMLLIALIAQLLRGR